MKFTCTQENLSHGLALVSRVAGKNAALPILNNVLIRAEKGVVHLATTNLELGLTTTIRAKIETEGSYTVQSRLLTDFINLLQNDKVTVEASDAGLTIVAGQTKTTIKGLSAEEFPVLPTIQPIITMNIEGVVLHQLLEGVSFAVANDESRPEISGVLIHFIDTFLVAAATDSYRLAERRSKITIDQEKKQSIILPTRTAEELLRVIPNDQSTVTLSISENQFYCQTPDIELISRTIEGHYPDYQQIVPTNWTTKITIDKNEFINNIRAASLFCKPGINDLNLTVDPAKKTITFTAANTTTGEHQAQQSCEVEGKEQSIVFNYRYLLEGLQSLAGDEIDLELQDAQAPGVIRPTKKPDDLYLLMPIRQ